MSPGESGRTDHSFFDKGAILAPVSREDPKPGRWILPLVVVGLIGFTYVFVNALPEAEVTTAPASTTAAPSTTATTSTTTTTTLAPAATAFIETTDTMERGVTDLAQLAQQINDSWDTRDVTYTPTREALEDLETQTIALADLAADTDVPNPATDEWEEVTAASKRSRLQPPT